MRRDALTHLFRGLVLATLPLGAAPLAGCWWCTNTDKSVDVPVACPGDASTDACVGDLDCQEVCGRQYASCSTQGVNRDAGTVHVYCEPDWCTPSGRRPAGLVAVARSTAASEVGAFFARVAHLESASVAAFLRLARELEAHGAPDELRAAARAAARDEARHARVTRRLARRHGATPPAVRLAAGASRSLEAIARENAVEGEVRETWGALVATFQSMAAEDDEVRAALAGIAADETAHADLGLRIGAWIRSRLEPAARRRVDEARRREVHRLAREAALEPPVALRRVAGLPSGAQAARLFEGARHLWLRAS